MQHDLRIARWGTYTVHLCHDPEGPCQACTLPSSVPIPTWHAGLTRRVRSVPTALNQAGSEGSEMAVPVPRGHSGSALKGRCGLLKPKA